MNKFAIQLFYHANCDNCCKGCKDTEVYDNFCIDDDDCQEFEEN